MIADDDPGIVDFLSIMLEFNGYIVTSTLDGSTLFQLEDQLPDLLLLDIWMSGVDGRDVCKYLKENGPTCGLPIVMLSASKDIGQSAIDAGADDFLAKPFEMSDLLAVVAKNVG
ncbi:MAG: response regulator [Ferruginibacter sp.]